MNNKIAIFIAAIFIGSNCLGSVQFNGTNNYLNAPETTANDISTTKISFGCWVYPTVSNVYQMLVGKLVPSVADTRQYAVYLSASGTSTIYLSMPGASAGADRSLSVPWKVNQWNHIFVTYDGTTITIYVNGQSSYTTSATGAITHLALSTLYIGAEGTVSNWTNGYIDDVRIYNRPLSASEVSTLGQSYLRNRNTSAPTGPIACYALDEGVDGATVVGASVRDLCGNNPATATNSPIWKASTGINYP